MLQLSKILELLGYSDSPHFRTKESQFEPESVHYFRLAKEQNGEKFSVKGFYVFNTAKGSSLAAKPAVCVAEATNLKDAAKLHRRIWNLGNVPFLIIKLPDQIRIYSGFQYEPTSDSGLIVQENSTNQTRLRSTLSDFSAESVDSARIWHAQRERLDTRNRVDSKLLANLKDLEQALAKYCVPQLDPATAHALIGKFVYLRYLRDRNILDDQWLRKRRVDLEDVFGPHATVKGLARVVEALETRFNGDVFHIELGLDSPLNDSHVRLVASVFAGDRIHLDESRFILQLHLKFQAYDFQHIPVETLSSIYEQFLHAQQKGKSQGAYYTPEILADYLLSEVETVRRLEIGMTILDASAGSGVFLVLAYRRLIELELKRNGSIEPTRLKEILLESIYGVERQGDACNVATFSLILTLLNYVSPPALHANEDFKFPNLLKKRIFCDDFFNPNLKLPIPKSGFDLVIGNPPWIELKPDSKGEQYARQWIENEESIAGNRVADAFAVKAGRLLSEEGVGGLLLPASTLFNLEGKRFRQGFFKEFSVARITNLANLRGNLFGGRVIQPATTLVFQKDAEEQRSRPILHYAPYAANQIAGSTDELWVLTIHASDIQPVSQLDAATGETSVWKLALWGTTRDARALDRIRQLYALTLANFCEKRGWGDNMPREGAQIRHQDSKEEVVYCEELKDEKRFDTDEFNRLVKGGLHFSMPRGALVPIPDDWCYVRKRGGTSGLAINRPPHILIPATWKNFLIYSERYFAVPARQIGLAAPKGQSELLRAITVYLASSLVDYFLFFSVPEWGVYTDYPIVVLRAVREIPTPDFSAEQITVLAEMHRSLVSDERMAGQQSDSSNGDDERQRLIDRTVFDTLSLPEDLRVLLEDFRDTRLQLTKGVSAIEKLSKRPSENQLRAYGRALRDELDRFLLGEARARIDLLASADLVRCQVTLHSNTTRSPQGVNVKAASSSDQAAPMLKLLRKKLGEQFSQWVYIDRSLRTFEDDGVQIFKAPRLMDWTRTQALNDADEILAEILEGCAEPA